MVGGTDVRRNLQILAGVALIMFLLLSSALFAAQATMSAQRRTTQEVFLPLEEDITEAESVMSGAFQREAEILATNSSAELSSLRDRAFIEHALATVQIALTDRLAKIDDEDLRARGETWKEKIGDFLRSDESLLAAVTSVHALDGQFWSLLTARQAELQDEILRVQDVVGRVRLTKVLMLRRIAGGTESAQQLVMGDLRAQGEAATDLQGSIQRYAMLVAQVGTLIGADALNSLLANELPQARGRVSENLAELADLTSSDVDLAPRVGELQNGFGRIERAVADEADSNSLASLRHRHFEERRHAQEIRASTATSAKRLLAVAEGLSFQARHAADHAGSVADARSRAIRIASILLALVGIAVCLFSARRIGQSIEQLGATNRRLSKLKEELLEANASVEKEVVAKTAQLTATMERFKTLVESTNAVPWEMDPVTLELTYISPQAPKILGIKGGSDSAHPPRLWDAIHPDDRARTKAALRALVGAHGTQELDLEYRVVAAEGCQVTVRSIASFGEVTGATNAIRGITFDVTRQKKLELELNQAQKLESIGRLASGVAHEINTPVQFVSDSVHFVRDAMGDLTQLIATYRSAARDVARGASAEMMVAALERAESDADLEFLLDKMPQALGRSLEGLDRVATIVRSMKAFAHPEQDETTCNLNEAIQSTLVIATNECKYVADVETVLGDIPLVTCHLGDINQAVLNIVVNAAHAIGDVVRGTETKGRITVRTRREDASVVISISDTGGGIPDTIGARIFDPFFTTKEVGKGTGQGLAIARSVVHERHGGELWYESEVGVGTTFFIRLPVEGKKNRAATGAAA